MKLGRASPDATKAEFSEQGALVDFLEETRAKGIGNLKDRAEHALGQRIVVFICVHLRSSAAMDLILTRPRLVCNTSNSTYRSIRSNNTGRSCLRGPH